MYLPESKQIKEWDRFTMQEQQISSVQLMERAGHSLAVAIMELFPHPDTSFTIFCGSGNNGGDGLVVARILHDNFYNVKVIEYKLDSHVSQDYLEMRSRLAACSNIATHIWTDPMTSPLTMTDVIIDAILGSGVNRGVQGNIASVIDYINTSPNTVVSIDVPSGMILDLCSSEACIQADVTLTIQSPKLPFFLEENVDKTGKIIVVDIGLSSHFQITSPFELLDHNWALQHITPRKKVSHKGHYGHAAVVAGSLGKTGAAVLATHACSRSGVGWVTAISSSDVLHSVIQTVPEAMSVALPSEALKENISKFDSIGIGCGLGLGLPEAALLKTILLSAKCPLIIDADAINLLAINPELMAILPSQCILTPHPGEFDRLFGKHNSATDRIQTQIKKSVELDCYIVLKTSITTISTPDGRLYFNTTGNAGMAKAGSGDVLLGLMTGFAARYKNAEVAASLAVFIHGLAGDLAAEKFGEESMKSGDLIHFFGAAFNQIQKTQN